MAGTAKTSQVLLSTATVMVGAQADLRKLTPATHSLGLVKNVTLTADPELRELTQGLTNDVVMSVKVGDGTRISMEVYEYTARNIAYALGLDGTNVQYDAPAAGASGVTSEAPATTSVKTVSNLTGVSAGDFISIQGGGDDLVHVAKVASIATTTITLEADWAIPAGMTFPAASTVRKVRSMDVGAQTPQASLSAKITGFIDPTKMEPVSILFPKIKITRGFNINFSTENYGNMPFEFVPYVQTASDPLWNEFGLTKMKMLIS